MKFGIESQNFDFIKKTLIDPIHEQGGKVWIFGSRARGNFHPYSDLDVLIQINTAHSKRILETAKEKLEESNLPFKVDIVLEENLAESYRKQIQQERVEV